LVRTLDQFDISTYGLTLVFLNTTVLALLHLDCSRKNILPKDLESIKSETPLTFYTPNVLTQTAEYIVHAQDVDKLELPTILIELSRKYFDELGIQYKRKRLQWR
jgi:hypothetical protein